MIETSLTLKKASMRELALHVGLKISSARFEQAHLANIIELDLGSCKSSHRQEEFDNSCVGFPMK